MTKLGDADYEKAIMKKFSLSSNEKIKEQQKNILEKEEALKKLNQ